MILADKMIQLRKKNGWSQEELAEKLDVTRQSVSKWEGAQSVPELDKVLQLSRLFGVSTDYLLKDELGESDFAGAAAPEQTALHRVTMAQANDYLAIRQRAAKRIAGAAFLCVVSPAALILLAAAQSLGALPVSEEFAAGLGMIVLLLLVAAAVALFITTGAQAADYAYLDTERFETEYGVTGMVRERQARFRDAYTRFNVLGACTCILSVIPVFTAFFFRKDERAAVVGVCGMLFIAGIGVALFILGGVPWAAMQKLLQEGDYTLQNKRAASRMSPFSSAYWLVVTGIFLAYSFATRDWGRSWIVWPVAGVLYAAVMAASGAWHKREPSDPE
ncbi:MAG: helix-turn-helix transcriptional regulator [Oscillospiraceae bacterium]|nr:helix-turn-helix transcriptional regulator [Oscillospiraceae bacterium]